MKTKIIDKTPSSHHSPLLIKELLASSLRRKTGKAVVSLGKTYSYDNLAERIERLANVIEKFTTDGGQTVSVMEWDTHRYLEWYFAIPCTGRILHTVNVRLSPQQILYTINDAKSELLVLSSTMMDVYADIADELTSIKHVIIIDDSPADSDVMDTRLVGEYENLLEQSSNKYDFPDFDEDTQATIFYTTGTTGLPKGVYYSHRQIVLHTLCILATFGTAESQGNVSLNDVYMPMTPMFHAHAWGWPYAATAIGMKQVYPGRYIPGEILELINSEGVSFSHCVPTLLDMILQENESKECSLEGCKFLLGGSSVPASLVKSALQNGIDIYTGYGMSETGPVQVINHLTKDESSISIDEQIPLRRRAGRPVLLSSVNIRDEQGCLTSSPHETGEIVFRSPWLTQGYNNKPEASEELWDSGYLHSGDLGYFDESGNLHVCDRKKDVIKSGGEWISSLQLESIISTHENVDDVAVIAQEDDKWGERPLVIAVLRDKSKNIDSSQLSILFEKLIERGEISKYAVPDKVVSVEKIDRTSVGKIDKKSLRKKYA